MEKQEILMEKLGVLMEKDIEGKINFRNIFIFSVFDTENKAILITRKLTLWRYDPLCKCQLCWDLAKEAVKGGIIPSH